MPLLLEASERRPEVAVRLSVRHCSTPLAANAPTTCVGCTAYASPCLRSALVWAARQGQRPRSWCRCRLPWSGASECRVRRLQRNGGCSESEPILRPLRRATTTHGCFGGHDGLGLLGVPMRGPEQSHYCPRPESSPFNRLPPVTSRAHCAALLSLLWMKTSGSHEVSVGQTLRCRGLTVSLDAVRRGWIEARHLIERHSRPRRSVS
jgi:hypothetical protein